MGLVGEPSDSEGNAAAGGVSRGAEKVAERWLSGDWLVLQRRRCANVTVLPISVWQPSLDRDSDSIGSVDRVLGAQVHGHAIVGTRLSMKLVNWNVEWATPGGRRSPKILERI